MSKPLSRRGWLTLLTRSNRARSQTASTSRAPAAVPAVPADLTKVAVIQGRYCLAYTSTCSVCSEQCPVPGAIRVDRGLPMVVPDVCTGCGVCHEVCPAPRNAVLVLARKTPASGPTGPAL